MNEAAPALSKVCAKCGARYPADALFCPLDGSPLQSAAAAQNALNAHGEPADDPYLGQEISGHIEIRQLVGIGAMGRVYRAFQKGIDRDVAVKILHRELSANAQLVSRFTREAKVASRLQHPNVVQVLLAGQLPDRALYMVMEYLEGLSLQSALAAAGGAMPLPKALHVAMQLCEAAGEAHAVGIVHRDLKPENVMLVRRGTDPDFVKVLDFGIARINWGEQSVATAAGLIFGTARYISPEGAQGNAVGPASDVYSIATLLYQMLAGRTPFEGDQAVGLLVQQIHDAPPHLRTIPRATYVPAPLADVIMANLAKDPKHREQDARALGHAIVDAAKQAGLSPEDISRPLLRRLPGSLQMAPNERTQQHELSAEMAERLSPNPSPARSGTPPPASPVTGAPVLPGDRPVMAATVKWEPPSEFQARLAEVVASRDRTSGIVPSSPASRPASHTPPPVAPAGPGSRPRLPSGVDETMDDSSEQPPYASSRHPIATPPPGTFPAPARSVPRTIPGDVDTTPRRTEYAQPVPGASEPPPPVAAAAAARGSAPTSPPRRTGDAVDSADREAADEPRRGRGVLLVVLCFVIGVAIAAGAAWRMGKFGGSDETDERYVARATDAMYKNHFLNPPGDNVREITDEGLKRWPNDAKLIDVRVRAANVLVSQAMVQRTSGDLLEALRLARAAHELDPNDPSAKRLVEQYEGELASSATPTATPLARPSTTPTGVPAKAGGPSAPPNPSASSATNGAFKITLEANVPQPRLGQTVTFTARVTPAKAAFESPAFTITGPGLPGGVTMAAQSPANGVFTASYAFLEAGRFEVVFAVQADGKPQRAGRTLEAGEGAPAGPAKLPDPAAKPSATAPSAAPSSSVKWM